jgi:hypothetical protein
MKEEICPKNSLHCHHQEEEEEVLQIVQNTYIVRDGTVRFGR